MRLDTKKAIGYIGGNEKLYSKILNSFYIKYKDFTFKGLDDNEINISAHSIKSISANLGADKLSTISKDIEKTLNKELFENFYEELNGVIKEIEEFLKL